MKNIGKYVSWVLAGATGVAIAECTFMDLIALAERGMSFNVANLLSLFFFLAAFYLQIIIHEAGHLVFGLLTGYRFSTFRIASFLWMREDGKLRMKRYKLAGTGGQCLMEPPELVDGRMPVVLYNMGGAILNLAASAVFFAIWCLIARVCGHRGWSTMFLMALSLCGVYSAVVNGVPMRMGMINNDGFNAMDIRRSPKAMRAHWIALKYSAMTARGKGILDMPEEWSELPTDEEMKNTHVAWLSGLKVDRLIAEHRFEEAVALLDHLLEADIALVDVIRCSLIYERIFCECMCERSPEKLSALRTRKQLKYMKAMKNHPGVIRTEYAYVHLVEMNADKACKLKERFERAARTYPHTGYVEHDRELMQLVDDRAMM